MPHAAHRTYLLFSYYMATANCLRGARAMLVCGLLTVEHVHGDRLGIGVRRQTRVLARIGYARPLDEQIRCGDLALLGDYGNATACRVVVDFLHGAQWRTTHNKDVCG